jgi:RNA polymerase sigma-70 factor (ECF subfamily)
MHQHVSENILQEGLAEGNVKVFDYLFHHYYSGLVVFAMKLVDEKEVAEDIVQEFFYKLWSEREKRSINQSFKSYFFSSVRNRCLDYLRHQKISRKADVYLAQKMQQDLLNESDMLVESELRERIHGAIDKLPEKCRKIFVMNRLEGMKPGEIAEHENISIRTVEGHIGKALKLLREELKPYLPGYIIALLLS